MLFSKKLICEIIPSFAKVDKQTFIKAISDLGMELEQIINHPENENLVIGKILNVTKHPNANKLNVCKVQIDETTTKTIVCGGLNVQPDKYAIVCLENAKLFDGTVIKYQELRGVMSEGMLCSYSELTPYSQFMPSAEQHHIVLFDKAIIGDKNWRKYLNFDDEIYDISIPANRNDLNNYFIFCKEIAGKLNLKLKKYNFNKIFGFLPKINNSLPLNIVSAFSLLTYDIKPQMLEPSDWNIKTILMNHNIKPVNKLLDQLAYISLISGCQTNVYDAATIAGQLEVKLAKKGDQFVALDGKTYSLDENDIVVVNNNEIVTLAAVINSQKTKITRETKRIIIEIANFNHDNIRKTALRLNLQTLSAKTASKPISNFFVLLTIKLIRQKLGRPIDQSINCTANWQMKPIVFNNKLFNEFVSNKISFKVIQKALKKLGFSVNRRRVLCPQWRLDITQHQDIVEEILKIIDIDSLEPVAINDHLLPLASNHTYETKQLIHQTMLNNYFNEVKTYNLVNQEVLKQFNLFNLKKPYLIQTSNSNRQCMRNNLLPGLLNVYKYNASLKHKLVPIYELQQIYDQEKSQLNLSALCCGSITIDPLSNSKIANNVLYLKAVLNEIGKKLNVTFKYQQVSTIFFYPNEALSVIYNEKTIGYIGKITKSMLKHYDLQQNNVYAMSVNLNDILSTEKFVFQIKSLSPYQELSKDINFSTLKNSSLSIDIFMKKLQGIENVVKAEIISVYHNNNDVIYTVRYYLNDSKQYNVHELETIFKKISNLITL